MTENETRSAGPGTTVTGYLLGFGEAVAGTGIAQRVNGV